jgi:hypothetical protein
MAFYEAVNSVDRTLTAISRSPKISRSLDDITIDCTHRRKEEGTSRANWGSAHLLLSGEHAATVSARSKEISLSDDERAKSFPQVTQ